MMDRIRGTGKAEVFMMRKNKQRMKAGWGKYKDEIVKIWKSEKRQGKPWGARLDKE